MTRKRRGSRPAARQPEQLRARLAAQYSRGCGPVIQRTIRAMLDAAAALGEDLPDLTVEALGFHHGHPTFICRAYPDDWLYTDNGMPVEMEERPCPHCGELPHPNRPDPCLGMLRGVDFACCGHGRPEPNAAYVSFDAHGRRDPDIQHRLRQARRVVKHPRSATVLYGDDALRYFRDRGVGPSIQEDQLPLFP
jgi:hypothetical protein